MFSVRIDEDGMYQVRWPSIYREREVLDLAVAYVAWEQSLPEAQRVTKSCLHYYTEYKESSWPRRCSGYCRGDERVRSGIDGLVVLETVVDTLRSDK